MDCILKFCFLMGLLVVGIFQHANATSSINDFERCESVVKKWSHSSIQQEAGQDKHILKDLLFFLHIPRTGGRTYFHCFLRKLYPSSTECPRSYDKLRFDPAKTKCRLLVTHDDYSMMSKLPGERTSVVTILRDPVDRVFSAYEFSIEVAARFLVHPNLTSATQMAIRLKSSKTKGVSTLDIWPWKYLVPWMRGDLFARRDARFNKRLNKAIGDSYNMEEVAMPLHKYINHHVAMDIIHNGATFQVAGLTNNSFLAESHDVRHCVQKYRALGKYVLQVAKRRLDHMLYVGLTEEHRESATMFANVVGAQVMSQLSLLNSSVVKEVENTEDRSTFSNSEPNDNESQGGTVSNITEIASPESGGSVEATMTVGKLMEAYEGCTVTLRKAQGRRRTASLKSIAPINFSKKARKQTTESVLQQIRSLNDLDIELYEYAKTIFAKQHDRGMQNSTMDRWGSALSSKGGINMWEDLSVMIPAMMLLLIAFVLLLVKVRRTKLKVKL